MIVTSGNNSVKMTIQSPAGAVFKKMAGQPLPNSPVNPSNENDSGTSKVGIELTLPTGTQTTTLTVAPSVTGNTPPAITPLANW